MSDDPNLYLSMMQVAFRSTDGTEEAVFSAFEEMLVTTAEARLVWNLFEPPVRVAQLRRYFGKSKFLLEHESSESVAPGHFDQPGGPLASDSGEPSAPDSSFVVSSSQRYRQQSGASSVEDSSKQSSSSQATGQQSSTSFTGDSPGTVSLPKRTDRHSPVPIHKKFVRGGRSPNSAAAAIDKMGKRSVYERLHDHRGVLIAALTGIGLDRYYEVEVSEALRIYVKLLRDRMPVTNRSRDTVRNNISKEDGDILWEEAKRRARQRAA
jgi:hypothetical protein